MTFVPILERELRSRARSHVSYWSRFGVVSLAVLICLPQLLLSSSFRTQATAGKYVFNGIFGAALFLVCAACLLTSDVISAERRGGTLGLLFLTRVKPFDVLLGKFGSAGTAAVCALIAFAPILMLPILAGGVTFLESLRHGLVLLDALFLALATGLWASARGHEWAATTRSAALLLLTLVLVPWELDGWLPPSFKLTIGLFSPLVAARSAGDAACNISQVPFWTSLLAVQSLGLLLLFGAGMRLRSSQSREQCEALSFTAQVATARMPGTKPRHPRQSIGDFTSPLEWLMARRPGVRGTLWAAAFVQLSYTLCVVVMGRMISNSSPSTIALASGLPSWAFGGISTALFTWAVSRFLIESRQTGEFEMLVTTPIGAETIVTAQWRFLKRAVRWPVLVMLIPNIIWYLNTSLSTRAASNEELILSFGQLFHLCSVVAGIISLCWLGLWFGSRASSQAAAILWTLGWVKLVPYLFNLFWFFLWSALPHHGFVPQSIYKSLPLWIPTFLTLCYYVVLAALVRRELLRGVSRAELERFSLLRSLSSARCESMLALQRARTWTPHEQ